MLRTGLLVVSLTKVQVKEDLHSLLFNKICEWKLLDPSNANKIIGSFSSDFNPNNVDQNNNPLKLCGRHKKSPKLFLKTSQNGSSAKTNAVRGECGCNTNGSPLESFYA